MKAYEYVPRTSLTPRMPMIIRVDGKAFHTYTRGFDRPWDMNMRNGMNAVACDLMKHVQGAKLAYAQSDEVSVLVTDYDKLTSSAWFDKNIQKCASVAASIATAAFNRSMLETLLGRYDVRELEGNNGAFTEALPPLAHFDARVFVLPKEEACNYFVWRQQDASRNSISMLAQSEFSHKQLHGKNTGAMQEMLMMEKSINWNDCEVWQKRGWCVTRRTVTMTVAELEQSGGTIIRDAGVEIDPETEVTRTKIEPDWEIPIFSKDTSYVDQHVNLDSEKY